MSTPTDRPTEDPLGLTIVTAPTDQPIGDPQDTVHTDNPSDDPISDPLGPLISAPHLDPSARSVDPNKPCDSSDPMTSEIATPKSPFKPPDPEMGGLVQVKHDAYSAWTGGKPKADWSELEETSPEYEQTTQLRPMLDDSGFSKRCKGFEDKFSKNGDLYKFQRHLIDHLKIMGMDTITYLPDPADNDQTVNVIMDHTWFTQGYVRSAAPIQYAMYDTYDRSNDRATCLMFVDSLNETLKGEIQDRIPDEPSFLEVWMLFIQTLQSDSMERFKDMEKEVRSLQPQQISGQNIAEMCLSFVKRCKGLTAAGVYDHQLNSKIIQNLLLADGNDQYKFALLQQQEKLNETLQVVRFMTKIEANEYLISRQLTFGDICCLAEDRYRQALGDKTWGPASNMKDSTTPSGAFSRTQLNALIQQFQGKQQREKSNDICHHCGQKGHWANECPNRANDAGPIANRGRDRNNARRPGRGGPRRGGPRRGGPGHRRLSLQARCGGGGRGHEGCVGRTGTRDYAPWHLVTPTNLEEQKYVNGRWFKFDPAASPPRWNIVRPTAPANNQANVLEFDPVVCMTKVPNYQAWTNVINSVPTYSTMGTSPAVASSPLIDPCPLSKQYKTKKKTQWVSLLLLRNWPMNH